MIEILITYLIATVITVALMQLRNTRKRNQLIEIPVWVIPHPDPVSVIRSALSELPFRYIWDVSMINPKTTRPASRIRVLDTTKITPEGQFKTVMTRTGTIIDMRENNLQSHMRKKDLNSAKSIKMIAHLSTHAVTSNKDWPALIHRYEAKERELAS